jgi:hypothetical protein
MALAVPHATTRVDGLDRVGIVRHIPRFVRVPSPTKEPPWPKIALNAMMKTSFACT